MKQRSKSQRARRNERRRYKRVVQLMIRFAGEAHVSSFRLKNLSNRYILAFDGVRPDSFLLYDTQTGKIADMNTTTKDQDHE